MNTSTYRTGTIEQLTVSVDGFESRALLTRFIGERTWSVRGSVYGEFTVECHDGRNTRFTKSNALRMAERFIRTGNDYL